MPDEKKQLIHRLLPESVRSILRDFNSRILDASSAAARLDVGRTRLYELRTSWLKEKSDYQPAASGGDRGEVWTPATLEFLNGFQPLQNPPNFQLVADEMDRQHGFKRARSTVESYIKATSVTVLFHPFCKLWVLEHSPKLTWPPILGHFTI